VAPAGCDSTDLAVLTPSFRKDAALFADLHSSVLANTADSVLHHVVVPPSDARLFQKYEGERCRVWTHRDLLPNSYRSVPRASGLTLNLRRPWPPVRGWVTQQIMKLAGTAAIDARAVLIADSDAVIVREATLEQLFQNGRLRHHRRDRGVTAVMERHVLWHNVARRLLGVPGVASAPLPDYISPIRVWDPVLVRSMLARIARHTGRKWVDAVAGELHVSEFVLYGVYVDEVLGMRETVDGDLCHNYYERTPLTRADGSAFAERVPPGVLGVMISSHSGTPPDVRRETFRRCRELAETASSQTSLFLAPTLQVLGACPC
jgi:Family of unknown function (DUF6492)